MPGPAKPTITGINGLGYTSACPAFYYPDPSVVYLVEIQRKVSGGSFALIDTLMGTPGTHPETDLTDGTAYIWRIRSQDSYGNYSPYSDEVGATTNLEPPTNLRFTATPTDCTLNWDDNSQNESGSDIYRTDAGGVTFHYLYTVGQNVTTKYDPGLTAGQTYKYYVMAKNALTQSAPSNIVEVFTADPPNAPSQLTATATATNKTRLNFHDNADNELGFYIYRSTDGISFSLYATIASPNVQTYEATTGLSSNTRYWWKVYAYNGSGTSASSNVADATTFAAVAPPSNLQLRCVKVGGVLGIEVTADDNSTEETDRRLERGIYEAPEEHITDGGFETWASATDLTNWTEYKAGTSTINRSTDKDTGTYALRFDISAADDYALEAQSITLVPARQYKITLRYKMSVAGKVAFICLKDSGDHKFLKTDGTWANSQDTVDLANQTSYTTFTLTFTAPATYTSYVIYVGWAAGWGTTGTAASASLFFDNLSLIAPWAEIATWAPNQTYYFDSDVTPGDVYKYCLRDRQTGSPDVYSAYCDPGFCAVLTVPAAVTALAISEHKDTWGRLTWTPPAGTVIGYKIERSPNGSSWTEIAKIQTARCEYKSINLTAGGTYYWRVRPYNAAGDGAYCTAISHTMDSVYIPTRFEQLIRNSKARLLYLGEANPLFVVQGWNLTSGKTYTFESLIPDSRALIDGVQENGVDLAKKTSIADVEATVSSWYYDAAAGKIYVHTSGGNDPVNYFIAASVWFLFTTGRRDGTEVVYNGNHYLPFIPADGIPDVSMEIKPYYEGNLSISNGTVSLINAYLNKEHFFDKRSDRYVWKNRKFMIRAGGEDFLYSEFDVINTGVVNSTTMTDQRFSLALRDFREGINTNLPPQKYTLTEFANLDPNAADKPRPFGFGAILNFPAICIDTVRRVFEFHTDRTKSVDAVRQGTATLTAGTDYFIDYQRGRITLARGLAYTAADGIYVDYHGLCNEAGEEISTGPEMFKYALDNWTALSEYDQNLDSIWATLAVKTTALSAPIYKDLDLQEFIARIEHSIMAYSYQDTQGRIGLRAFDTTAPSDIKSVLAQQSFEFSIEDSMDSVYTAIHVHHSENPQTQRFQWVQRVRNTSAWKYGVAKQFDSYTLLTSDAEAEALGDAILEVLDKKNPVITVPRVLHSANVGDTFLFSRDRYYSTAGTASDLQLRIIKIDKLHSAGKTTITVEPVL